MLARLLLFIILLAGAYAQIPCYVDCKANACLASNPLNCTDCDPGLSLVDGECIPVGAQRVKVL